MGCVMGYQSKPALLSEENNKSAFTQGCVASDKPTVSHEGKQIYIRTAVCYRQEGILIPLRNGFPLFNTARSAPVYSLLSSEGLRVGTVVKVEAIGLYAYFDTVAPPGRYFIDGDTVSHCSRHLD